MMNRRNTLLLGGSVLAVLAARTLRGAPPAYAADEKFEVMHTDAEWQKLLTPAQYNILRQQGTEAPFSSPLLNEHRKGIFNCAGCALPLYPSDTKFDSGTGWPSFWKPIPRWAWTGPKCIAAAAAAISAMCSLTARRPRGRAIAWMGWP
jgi:peptide-methionine (R)-S-oxide reductase